MKITKYFIHRVSVARSDKQDIERKLLLFSIHDFTKGVPVLTYKKAFHFHKNMVIIGRSMKLPFN